MTDKQDMPAAELAAEIDRLGGIVAGAGAELQALAARNKRKKRTAATLRGWGNLAITLGLELRSMAEGEK